MSIFQRVNLTCLQKRRPSANHTTPPSSYHHHYQIASQWVRGRGGGEGKKPLLTLTTSDLDCLEMTKHVSLLKKIVFSNFICRCSPVPFGITKIQYIVYLQDDILLLIKEFSGNTDSDTIVSHDLTPPIVLRYVRFLILTWSGGIAMRVELYGCQKGN